MARNPWSALGFVFILALSPLTAAFPQSNAPVTNAATVSVTDTNAPYLGSFYGDEGANGRARKPKTPNAFLTMLKMLLYIAVLGGIVYLIIRYIIKKGKLPTTEDSEMVEILLTKQMGMGACVQVVKMGSVYYMLSLSSEGLRLLDRIDDKEQIDWIELHKDKSQPQQAKFFDFLSHLPGAKAMDRFDFMKNQKDRLKKL